MSKFFDDLGNKAKRVFTRAQEVVENGCDRFVLSQEIDAQKDSVNKLFAELGRFAYHGSAELAGVRPKQEITADISAAVAKLTALEEQYEELTAPVERPDIDLQTEEPVANCFCHKCGQPQDEGDLFCNKCGTKLK